MHQRAAVGGQRPEQGIGVHPIAVRAQAAGVAGLQVVTVGGQRGVAVRPVVGDDGVLQEDGAACPTGRRVAGAAQRAMVRGANAVIVVGKGGDGKGRPVTACSALPSCGLDPLQEPLGLNVFSSRLFSFWTSEVVRTRDSPETSEVYINRSAAPVLQFFSTSGR